MEFDNKSDAYTQNIHEKKETKCKSQKEMQGQIISEKEKEDKVIGEDQRAKEELRQKISNMRKERAARLIQRYWFKYKEIKSSK